MLLIDFKVVKPSDNPFCDPPYHLEIIGKLRIQNCGEIANSNGDSDLRMYRYRFSCKENEKILKVGHLTHKRSEGFLKLAQKVINKIFSEE